MTYRNDHKAPINDGHCSPLWDVTLNETYPKDFYEDTVRMYGDGEAYDYESASVIRMVRNKPNSIVKIYRAVPDYNYDIKLKINSLNSALNYNYKYGFFPISRIRSFFYFFEIIDKFIPNKSNNYDENKKEMIDYIHNEKENLNKSKSKRLSINAGDWVSVSNTYARNHGMSNLNSKYTILSKSVKAKYIWSDGNSINEQGYDPR